MRVPVQCISCEFKIYFKGNVLKKIIKPFRPFTFQLSTVYISHIVIKMNIISNIKYPAGPMLQQTHVKS